MIHSRKLNRKANLNFELGSRWKAANKSEPFIRNVINRFAYIEQETTIESLMDDMIAMINSHSKYIPQTLYEVTIRDVSYKIHNKLDLIAPNDCCFFFLFVNYRFTSLLFWHQSVSINAALKQDSLKCNSSA